MAYLYKLTPLAQADLDDAISYIAENLSNRSAANKLYHSVVKEIKNICSAPFSFPNCSYYLIDDETVRHALIGNYVLIFEIDEGSHLIKILRFLYGGMDIANMGLG